MFDYVLDRLQGFSDYESVIFTKFKNLHFSKGVNPWFWSKIAVCTPSKKKSWIEPIRLLKSPRSLSVYIHWNWIQQMIFCALQNHNHIHQNLRLFLICMSFLVLVFSWRLFVMTGCQTRWMEWLTLQRAF